MEPRYCTTTKMCENCGYPWTIYAYLKGREQTTLVPCRKCGEPIEFFSSKVESRRLTVDEYQEEIGKWGDETFPYSSIGSVLSHLREEYGEFCADFYAGNDKQEEELADMFLLMLHFAYKSGFSLFEKAEEKMEINRARNWNKTSEETGHFKHVEES